ncbi:hypothetical protein Q7P36_009836 [Cladosporium allicinum]
MANHEVPLIAALFQVVFDQKVGYTIAWKQTRSDTDLDGVEYQCLPSGLHSVREDVVYFIHGAYAGVSAFVQEEADKEHRNASFVAVGALVPLSYGRLGKSWLHVEALRSLAKAIVKDQEDKKPLEAFWDEHGNVEGRNGAASPTAQRSSVPGDHKRKRTLSDATGNFAVEEAMPLDHPALSMPMLVATFGPLLFPLYREALLQKRILLLGSAPVQETCNFVYDLSILSNVPQSLRESVSTESGRARLQPLFNVGVFDITRLENNKDGWIACTTDAILGEKKKLYDILVELLPRDTAPGRKAWPTLRTSSGEVIKATQRDFRRYTFLCRELSKVQRGNIAGEQYRDAELEGVESDDEDTAPLVRPLKQTPGHYEDDDAANTAEADIVQPESWSAMAYKSFMWWASAAEMDAWEEDEISTDQALLNDLPDLDNIMGPSQGAGDDDNDGDLNRTKEAQKVATILVAYFHRVTEAILRTLADNIEHADDNTEEGYEEDDIHISSDDMRRMGVDAWNPRDREFVQDSIRLYFKREAVIEEDGIRMCGVRFC